MHGRFCPLIRTFFGGGGGMQVQHISKNSTPTSYYIITGVHQAPCRGAFNFKVSIGLQHYLWLDIAAHSTHSDILEPFSCIIIRIM